MNQTPIPSLKDESLNGSWIDINSASQIPSPVEMDPPEFIDGCNVPTAAYPSIVESVQNLGLISFQVERFLQEAQRNHKTANSRSQLYLNQQGDDDNSGIYSSESDVSVDEPGCRALKDTLRQVQRNESNNIYDSHSLMDYHQQLTTKNIGNRFANKESETFVDQYSDSLSFLSRASAGMGEQDFKKAPEFQDFDWLWDWTAQPEYFSGQEWKVHAPKQEYLLRQRQMYCANFNKNHGAGSLFSGEVISLLFLTNILSILIGAGLTYSILMRKPTV